MTHRSSTPSYILTLPLRYQPWQKDRLDKLFKVAGYACNNLIADRKKALQQLERSRQWKYIISRLSEINAELMTLNGLPQNKSDAGACTKI